MNHTEEDRGDEVEQRDMRYTPIRRFYSWVGFFTIIALVVAVIAATIYVFAN